MGFNEALGFDVGEDGRSIVLAPQAGHEVAPGTVHFAVLTTLGEVAAAQAAGEAVVPAQVAVQLVRPAGRDAALVARGRVLKSGRTLIFAEAEVTQHDRLVAKVTVTFARRS